MLLYLAEHLVEGSSSHLSELYLVDKNQLYLVLAHIWGIEFFLTSLLAWTLQLLLAKWGLGFCVGWCPEPLAA